MEIIIESGCLFTAVRIPGFGGVDEFEEVFKVLRGTYDHLLRRGDFQVWVELRVDHCSDKTKPVKLQREDL